MLPRSADSSGRIWWLILGTRWNQAQYRHGLSLYVSEHLLPILLYDASSNSLHSALMTNAEHSTLLDHLYTLSLGHLRVHVCCQERCLWPASRNTRLFEMPPLSSVCLILQCDVMLIDTLVSDSFAYESSRCSFRCADNCSFYWCDKDCSRETKARFLLAMLSWWEAGIFFRCTFVCR